MSLNVLNVLQSTSNAVDTMYSPNFGLQIHVKLQIHVDYRIIWLELAILDFVL